MNLLSNACKFQQNGTIKVKAWVSEGISSISSQHETATFINVKVKDKGIGIDEKDQSNIFEPFK